MTTIAEFSKTSTAPFVHGFATFAGIMVRGVQRFTRAFKHRHDAATLAGLDDRMLADIGLTRGDLRDAFSQPLWEDPTVLLVNRAGERRTRRHRVGLSVVRPAVEAPSIVPAGRPSRSATGLTIGRPR